ncbi:S8 family peptidase [Aquisphaera insulae]|uniref:S8 family peptidase n=1 Tax=Aquisphaera insulae TaxID=2712864 RepID=UPI0013EC5642|nr:S8 family peptidase [Aquisphaera insulae]
MPPINNPFPHLALVLRYDGAARFHQQRRKPNAKTTAAQEDRATHGERLGIAATNVSSAWKLRVADREEEDLPTLPKNVPLLLEIDTMLDLDELRKRFGFEVVSEEEDGFVIVASEDLDLNAFNRQLVDFVGKVTGSGSVARVHSLVEDNDQSKRLARILSEHLREQWPELDHEGDYVVDLGVSSSGDIQIPPPPSPRNRGRRESDKAWARRQGEYAELFRDWTAARNDAYQAWEELSARRHDEIRSFVDAYGGEVLDQFEAYSEAALPEEFTLRIRIKGKGLRDLVLNYPFLFEVVEPDDVALPQAFRAALERSKEQITIVPPPEDAPAVCIIDSGIQEGHYLLHAAIDVGHSRCFLPGMSPTDVADYFPPSGHGTRVAGAVLFGESIPRSGSYDASWWIQNARVLDANCSMPDRLFPPTLLNAIILHFHKDGRRARIFNHSITAGAPCRTRHMSAWAAEIDHLSCTHDVLFVVSSGNLLPSNTTTNPGILEHLVAERTYPAYLSEPSSRIANPAQSLQALTVGSVGYREFEDPDWSSCARGEGHPSAFSRSGLGIWNTIKPEVVEFGGDNLVSRTNPPIVDTPPCGRECYPELVRSTLTAIGPAYDRDQVGTSYAAPKVARIAARLQEILPKEPYLLYRALIVQSARWPGWTNGTTPLERGHIVRWIGYGLPDMERATTNTEHRTTLISSGDRGIKAKNCHIYQVPIPRELRRPGEEFDVLIEVTLTYAAQPRRTRRNRRHYFSTWVDWKSSNRGEDVSTFRDRALKTDEEGEAEGDSFRWSIGISPTHGNVRGVSRSSGATQKDWVFIKSNALTEDFCIAVIGHQGWSKDPDSTARYALAVSIEVVGREIPIYSRIRDRVADLQAEVEAEAQIQAETEVEVLAD